MAKPTFLSNDSSFFRSLSFVVGATVCLLMVWTALWSDLKPRPDLSTLMDDPESTIALEDVTSTDCAVDTPGVNLRCDPLETTFYDDPKFGYSIEKPIKDWDEKRREWLKHHPSFAAGVRDRILLVTGSQPSTCKNPIGDNLLLRLFKNKVDYCRIHGYDIFYNNAFLHPKMSFYWAKLPVIRSAMIAHPEAEWVWWVDSDAVFTDMDFKIPLEKYNDYNLVVDGWPNLIYEKRSWIGLNAGIFLIRNCQWSIDFMKLWASMSPITPNYEKWGKTFRSIFKDKTFPEADDQSALVYLMLKEKHTWAARIYLENEYSLQGYWEGIVGTLDNITGTHVLLERGVRTLRRRHAEKVSEYYGALREQYLRDAGYGKGVGSRPFITHFTGCQPCSGDHNPTYGDSCWKEMARALNFADNQVLRNFGFVHPDILDSSSVSPLPFDFPR